MGKLFGQLVFLALVIGIWQLSDWVDQIYMNLEYPPIQSPLNAPIKVPVYRAAAPLGFGVDETAKGCLYYWEMESPWPLDAVLGWYKETTETEPTPLHQGQQFLIKFQPLRAKEGELITVTIAPWRHNGTHFKITEDHFEENKLPPAVREILEKIGLYMVILGFYTLYKDRVIDFFARLWRWQLLRSGVPLYSQVGGLWYDPIRQQHWDSSQKILEGLGFTKVCDCVHTLPKPREFGRIMQKHAHIYALANFARIGRKRMVWFEFFSMFVDGSAVYTTTHRDPNFSRPKEYPLFQVPESADVRQVLMVHQQNVDNSGKQLAMVAPDKILKVLSELERTVMIHKPAPPPKMTRADTGIAKAKPEELKPPPLAPGAPLPPPPLADAPAPMPLMMKPLPPVPQAPTPETPEINEVTAAMAKYAANREASVLGIAAVAAEEKSGEFEAAQAEKAAKEAFKDDVIERINAMVPGVEIKVRDILSLLITIDRGENELDLETPYYMAKGSPDNRSKIVNGIALRVKQGSF